MSNDGTSFKIRNRQKWPVQTDISISQEHNALFTKRHTGKETRKMGKWLPPS